MKLCITHADSPLGKRVLALLEQSSIFDEDDSLLMAVALPQMMKFKGRYTQARPLCEDDFAELDIIINTSDEFTQQILLHLSPDTYVVDLTGHLTQSEYTTLVDLSMIDDMKIDKIKTILPISHIVTSSLTVVMKQITGSMECMNDKKSISKSSDKNVSQQKVENIIISTYQAISDEGQKAMQALDREKKHDEMHINEGPQFFDQYIYSNVIPSVGAFLPSLDTTEEMQIISEIKQLLSLNMKHDINHIDLSEIGVSVTCMRVPMKIGHVISVTVVMKNDVNDKQFEDMKKMLKISKHVMLVEKEVSITPKDSIGHNQVIVSRFRRNGRILSFVITYDNMTFRAYIALEVIGKLMGDCC